MKATDAPQASLTLASVTKTYGEKTVLHAIDLDIRPGEFVTLLGPSGCGKSTALKIVGGFEAPDSGSVRIGGVDVTATPARERGTGIVFQQYSLFPHLTAAQNIEFGLKVKRWGRAERHARGEELLALVGLEEHGGKYPHQLSGGQQQRVALARALAVEPRILLLDEPLSALDALVRERLREEIVRIHRERGTTTIMVTHDQEEALAMADRVAVMHEGRIAQFDTPQRVYSSPAPGFVASFIGVMNLIRPDAADTGVVRIFGEDFPRATLSLDTAGDALIRPEDLNLVAEPGGDGLLVDITLRGGTTSATVLLGDLERRVRVDLPTGNAGALRTGDRVRVSARRASRETALFRAVPPTGLAAAPPSSGAESDSAVAATASAGSAGSAGSAASAASTASTSSGPSAPSAVPAEHGSIA